MYTQQLKHRFGLDVMQEEQFLTEDLYHEEGKQNPGERGYGTSSARASLAFPTATNHRSRTGRPVFVRASAACTQVILRAGSCHITIVCTLDTPHDPVPHCTGRPVFVCASLASTLVKTPTKILAVNHDLIQFPPHVEMRDTLHGLIECLAPVLLSRPHINQLLVLLKTILYIAHVSGLDAPALCLQKIAPAKLRLPVVRPKLSMMAAAPRSAVASAFRA